MHFKAKILSILLLAASLFILVHQAIKVEMTPSANTSTAISVATSEIADLSAPFVYNINKDQLRHSLSSQLNNNKIIRGVKITDAFSDEVFFSYYTLHEKTYFNVPLPKKITNLAKQEANIAFSNQYIGLLEVYYDLEMQPIRNSEEGSRFENKTITLAGFFIALISSLFLVFSILSQRSLADDNSYSFGTTKFSIILVVLMSIFITLSMAGGWYILDVNKQSIEDKYKNTARQTLHEISVNINKLSEIRANIHHYITQKPTFQTALAKLVLASEKENLQEAAFHEAELIAFFNKYDAFISGESKTIISSEGKILLNYGSPLNLSQIDMSSNSAFIRAVSGKMTLSPSITSVSFDGKIKTSLYLVIPIFNLDQQVVAVSFNEIGQNNGLSSDFDNYNVGESGEFLYTDRSGNIISPLRFDIVSKANVKFSKSIAQITALSVDENEQAQLASIVDYRGKEVFVSAQWNEHLNMAYFIKKDKSEVLSSFYSLRDGAYIIFGLITLFSVPFTLFTLYTGKRANDKVKASRYEILTRLGSAAEFKDNDTAHHITRMSYYSVILAKKMSMNKEWRELLLHASPMHDIGKIGVPDHILNKPGKLDPEEWEIMKRHPEYGAAIIADSNSALLNMAKDIALYHHEKWNGKGYPYGLIGEAIPLSARIVAVADVFDALTSERVYKKAWPIDDSVELIKSESGQHFDPEVVDAFTQSIDDFVEVKRKFSDSIDD